MDKQHQFVLWFDQLGIDDVGLVGGKNASLGEMYRTLTKRGVRVPNGFAVSAYAYRYLLERAGVREHIKAALKGLNVKDVANLSERGRTVRNIILGCEFPADLRKEITTAYSRLCREFGGDEVDVAVRSSATAEDLPDASFAGQQETFLNIRGEHELLDACRKCFASLFTNRAIAYREEKGFDHFQVALSIGVQKMVRSDLACSGVMFTLDTESGFPDAVFITGSWGLGESVVQGAVNPDEWYVFKPTLEQGFAPIIQKKVGDKASKIIYAEEGTRRTIKTVQTSADDREQFCLDEKEVLELARWGIAIEDHYSKKRNKWMPMDIEWAKDGESGKLFIVQARPETVQSQRSRDTFEEYRLQQKGRILVRGKSVGGKIGQGIANVIKDVKDIKKFKPGQVLVTEMTDPDWVVIMRQASAIVTDKGGRTSHAAIVSRELGLPCVVGTNVGTKTLKSGQKLTVSCAEGEEGKIYEGLLKFGVKTTKLGELPRTKTRIMVNVGNPDEAFSWSFIPNDGVGLARMEFIINEYIKAHPLALLGYAKLDEDVKERIDSITVGYPDKGEFFVDKLAQGVAMIGAAFWPKDVIVRFSDFKSNEYANLLGGRTFEPDEENPMLGWRGASRYYSEGYKDAFALECEAIKRVRETFGLRNVKVMIPMCRTPEEGKKVLAVMAKNGLMRGKHELEVYVMCELPSNVILAEEYAKIFDGFSIGSNDLTQTTLGVDRDSALVADVYDERHEAVKRMMALAIHGAHKHHRKIGICGEAPSTFPDLARFLVDCGIDSISSAPDAAVKVRLIVAEHEKKRKHHA